MYYLLQRGSQKTRFLISIFPLSILNLSNLLFALTITELFDSLQCTRIGMKVEPYTHIKVRTFEGSNENFDWTSQFRSMLIRRRSIYLVHQSQAVVIKVG